MFINNLKITKYYQFAHEKMQSFGNMNTRLAKTKNNNTNNSTITTAKLKQTYS